MHLVRNAGEETNGSVVSIIEELADNFEILGDWEQRYEYISDLGDRLAPLTAAEKTHDTKVHACMSNVWIVGELSRDLPPAIAYRAECDTPIIRGVIAILLLVYSGTTPQEALDLDADDLFERLGLFDHLSPTRHVGIYAIVEHIRAIALECQQAA